MWNKACEVVDLSVDTENSKMQRPTYEQLEKALYKACEKLESMDYEINMLKSSPYAYDCEYTNSDEWMKWCLDEESY